MVTLASTEEGVPVGIDDLDADPWLLNVLNGTVDLRTGEPRPYDPDDLISRLAPVEYNPDATCPTWLAFVSRIMSGDIDLISYLQRSVGYSLTGSTREQVLFLPYGTGANGKTTAVETVRAMLGDYAQQMPAAALMERRSESTNDIARLRGARFVSAAETNSGHSLNEALVKAVSGGDRVTARFLYQENTEFHVSGKIWLATNNRPTVRELGEALWRRLRVIPFEVTIPVAERDPDLLDKLIAELPGILAWAVQGCRAWQRDGLQTPAEVQNATDEYRTESDPLAPFLEDCCIRGSDYWAASADLYNAYTFYCEHSHETPAVSSKAFQHQLRAHGLVPRQKSGPSRARGWSGIGLKSDTRGVTEVEV